MIYDTLNTSFMIVFGGGYEFYLPLPVYEGGKWNDIQISTISRCCGHSRNKRSKCFLPPFDFLVGRIALRD